MWLHSVEFSCSCQKAYSFNFQKGKPARPPSDDEVEEQDDEEEDNENDTMMVVILHLLVTYIAWCLLHAAHFALLSFVTT